MYDLALSRMFSSVDSHMAILGLTAIAELRESDVFYKTRNPHRDTQDAKTAIPVLLQLVLFRSYLKYTNGISLHSSSSFFFIFIV